MMVRKPIPLDIQEAVLVLSRRRCAFCFGLDNDLTQKNGQIAHINRKSNDSRQENLAFLCLDHHDKYDSTSSQSKGLTEPELRHYRDQLYKHFEGLDGVEPYTDSLFAEFKDLIQPRWRHIYEKALAFYTARHRTQEATLMTLDGPKSTEEIASRLIPPDDLSWTMAIIQDAIDYGWLELSTRQPGRYEATVLTRVLLEALNDIPESVKRRAGVKIWRPDLLEPEPSANPGFG
jgi:hypothetical protein